MTAGPRLIVPLVTPFTRGGALDSGTSNPTGTIKAGVRLRGIDAGVPRLPGQDLLPGELTELQALLSRQS